MTRKRIIFHIGAHKTGTTYLQSLFSQYNKELNAVGVDYPYPETKEVLDSGATVGNVIRLLYLEGLIKQKKNAFKMAPLAKLWNAGCTNKLVQIAKSSEYETILFSSEGVSVLELEDLKYLYDKFSKEFNFEFILFVRDPFDYVYSAWRQIVKAGLSTVKFDKYVLDRSSESIKNPKKLGMFYIAEVLIKNNMRCKIINYDSYRKELAGKFFEEIGIQINLDAAKKEDTKSLHNRSLSPSEAEIQSIINTKYHHTQFPAYFRNTLLVRTHHQPAVKNFYSMELDKKMLNYFQPLLDDINTLIIGDQLRTSPKKIQSNSLTIDSEDVEVLIDAIQFVELRRSVKVPLLQRIKHFFKMAALRNVPFDFDAKAYLEMNRDIAVSGIDPYLHYSRNGYREGRPYRYY